MAGKRTLQVCAAAFGLVMSAVPASASAAVSCEAPLGVNASTAAPRGRVAAGFDGTRTWLTADYRDLRVRKYATRNGSSSHTELHYRGDVITIALGDGAITVTRGGQSLRVDSPAALEALQRLLAGSGAMFAARHALSELETTSALDGPEVAVLSSLALAASLVGDTGAPRRLADRFAEKRRGIFRQVVMAGESCWGEYEGELMDAWNDLQGCMDDAEDDGFLSAAYQRISCNALWAARGVSAEFEYIKCISPLSAVPRMA